MQPQELHIIRESAEYFESRGSDAFAEKLRAIVTKYGKTQTLIEQELFCRKFRTKVSQN